MLLIYSQLFYCNVVNSNQVFVVIIIIIIITTTYTALFP